MKNILLSIVAPIYNGGKRMSVLLDSIVGQLTNQMELILVNNGSKDDTEKVCLEYASCYDQVKYLCQENAGVCVARELGISVLGGL